MNAKEYGAVTWSNQTDYSKIPLKCSKTRAQRPWVDANAFLTFRLLVVVTAYD